MPWVLSSKEINFPYPLGLTLLHMVFSSVLCFMLTKVLKIMKVEQGMTPDIKDELWMYGCISSVVPIGAMFAMTMAREHHLPLHICCLCSNVESNHASCCFILGVLAGLEVMSCRMLLIMSVISFGVPVASYGECSLPLNPMDLPGGLKMDAQGTWSFKPLMLMLTSLCTFALNLSVCLVISHTSALTVAGVVKDWVVVLLSALLFADTNLTLINLLGYAIAIAGVAAYNNHKLKKEASCVSSDEPAQSIPLVSTSTSNQ
ncbi:UNVERIFIED_CONTAM: putative sugar phosphate/phosphate translocator [Sesamum angustifolium]|uniref:Sugar phosphate/phosphate translocator n=1 Tax=Sesamum angustifolium TaxID=2727405 RepID=A0AAW2KWP0_9LAMI